MHPFVLGIDVAAQSFTAATWHAGAGQLLGTFPNTSAGFAQLAALPVVVAAPAIHLVLEPTGGYELPLAHFALAQGWQVSLPSLLEMLTTEAILSAYIHEHGTLPGTIGALLGAWQPSHEL